MAMRFFGYDESGMAGLPGLWLSAWTRPWGMFGNWNALWGGWSGPWRRWLESVAAMPAAWVPALAEERQGQPASIAFFLPWLPRIEAQVSPLDHGDDNAVRMMLRATLPGGLGGSGLEVDATVRRYRAGGAALEQGETRLALPPDGEAAAVKPAGRGGRRAADKG
ncbi:MAG: hypothetical protein LBK55_04640 [Azoarcus sp.]|jgi:hypothetical protein|nr:hypothetical protein [Azoarcus sp.]